MGADWVRLSMETDQLRFWWTR